MITKAIDILQLAKSSGVQIHLENGRLTLKFSKGKSIDPQLLEEIKSNKEMIIHFLNDSRPVSKNEESVGKELLSIKRNADQNIPLSFSQERLWFIDRLEGSTQYHMPSVLRLKGRLNNAALVYALKTIIVRHEVLRTVFQEVDNQVHQQVKVADEWSMAIVNGAVYAQDQGGLKHCIQQLIGQPFDLSKDYMLRAGLVTLVEDEHVLVVTMHHIASDGWSRSVLVKEVMELYRDYEEKKASSLHPLPLQYADYSIWQRQHLSGGALEQKLAYWKQKLEDVAPLQLPTDFPRPAVQSTRGASAYFNVDKHLSDQLQELGNRNGTTLFMTLLAAFKVLLFRYTGQQDICVGSPIAGRQQPELETLIGFFANTLALRTVVNDDLPFVELLQLVKRTTIEAQQYQEVPFEKVVDAVVKERSLSRTPLTQVMFSLQNTPEIPVLKLGAIQFSKEEHEHTTAMFDISFFVNETVNGLYGTVEYSTELFTEKTICQLMGHFKQLLACVTESADQLIGDLLMLDNSEVDTLVVQFNDNKATYPSGKTIMQLFEDQALAIPGNLALVVDAKQVTYKELNEQANRLAHYLRAIGIGKEMLVPVCIERGIQMIVGILGVLKSGAAYVPVDPEYPADRIRYILEDCNARMVISSKAASQKIPVLNNLGIIALDENDLPTQGYPSTNPCTEIHPDQLAYVIYTSGTTGRPKGVMIEHGNVYAFICWCIGEFATSKFDIVYASTSICFDLSIYEIFYPLSLGKPIRVIENGLHIGKYLKGDRFVLINSVPVVIENLLKEGRDLTNISVINMAGEPVPLQVLQGLDTERIAVRNLYGPTEDTTYSTVYRLRQNKPILIGHPIANSSVYILSSRGKPVPVGVAGEICLGGAGVARGYLNKPELTIGKFIPDSFSAKPGARLYRTGDLGRWLPNGNIEYMGRIDNQVKIRGFRVEPGEVEAVLNDLQQVSTSCVVVKKPAGGANALVSYFIPDNQVVRAKEQELQQAQVLSWKEVYEIEYAQTEGKAGVDEEFNLVGWNDSFTGEAIPAQQMDEWVQEIVNRISPIDAGTVLEIGCGTGLIYYQLAGKVKKYIGTDFSRSSIQQVTQRIAKGLRDYGATELFVAAAHEVSVNVSEQVDTVILNSIVQYFPGEAYMDAVIWNSMDILKGKGRIIIGDIRDHRLLALFKSRLLLNKMQQSVSVKEFNWAVEQDLLKEEELCLSPEYFYRLPLLYPGISHIDIQWKKATYINELSLYRYTVIIYVGIELPLVKPDWLSLSSQKDRQQIQRLVEKGVDAIALKDVNNYRVPV